jgi:hypothetical protein
VEKYLEVCSACAERVIALHELIADIGAPVPQPRLDVAEHVSAVMKRLDAKVPSRARPRWATWGGALAAAAALVLLWSTGQRTWTQEGTLTARGGPTEASLSRDVGLQLYAEQQSLRPLEPGSRIRADVALTAGLRNLASERAHLLLFAVDARQAVHWIAPAYTEAGTDPGATPIEPALAERLLPSSAVFDDLAPGPLRVVAIITREPTHVSSIEGLPAEELEGERLIRHFPRAEIRQFQFDVTAVGQP